MPKISVVIPTYDEEDCIARTVKEIPACVDEIIVVDLSSDKTSEIAKRAGCSVFRQKGIGFGNAFKQGVKHSKGDIIILMDADGSHNPKDILKLIKKIKEGYDCVFASRYTIESHSEDDTLLRSFGNWFITNLVNFKFGINTSDSLFLYTAIKRKAYNKLNLISNGFEYCIELLVKAYVHNLKLAEVPSTERKRFANKTKVHDLKHGYILIKSIFVWKKRLSKLMKGKLSNKQFVHRFNNIAFKFDKISNSYTVNRRYNHILKNINGKTLEVGAATGNLKMKNHILCDLSPEMCKIAEGRGFNVVCCDAEKLKFKSNSFNTVVSAEMIYYLNHPEKFIQESYRVLKDRGRIIITTGNQDMRIYDVARRWLRNVRLSKMYFDDGAPAFITLDSLQSMLVKNNFRIKSVKKMVFFPFKLFHKLNLIIEKTFLKHFCMFIVIIAEREKW